MLPQRREHALGESAAGDLGALASAARAQIGRTADREQLALANHSHQAAQLLGFRHVMRREEDGRALARSEGGKVVAETGGGHGIEAGSGLVEKHESGAMQQRPGDGQLLLHAAAPLHHGFLAAVPQTEMRQQFLDALVQLRFGHVRHAPVEAQVVLRTEPLVKAGVFEQRPGAGADLGALRSRIEAQHLSASAGWFDQAEEQSNGGRLAGAVGAEKTEY